MKIYDCFTFFNELDLLEIRLTELSDIVDYFVIVEGDKTHKGKPKKFIFEKNKKRFKKWERKIIYIKTKLPEKNLFDRIIIFLEKLVGNKTFFSSDLGLGNWKLENYQRNSITKGLKNAKKEDIILISDLDEIPSPIAIKKLKKEIIKNPNEKFAFNQKFFNYHLNGFVGNNWVGTKAVLKKTLIEKYSFKPQIVRVRKMRNLKNLFKIPEKQIVLNNGGWHFSYLGGEKKVKEKIKSIVEGKEKYIQDIQRNVKKGRDLSGGKPRINYIKIDKSFPKVIYKNQKKWKYLIK